MQHLEITAHTNSAEKSGHESEIYAFLDALRHVKFYGEITLYFQAGNIEHCRTVSRIAKKDIVKAYQKPIQSPQHACNRKKIIVKVKDRAVSKAAGKSHIQKYKQDTQLLFALPELSTAVIPLFKCEEHHDTLPSL